jgi:periplasmic protein TonB
MKRFVFLSFSGHVALAVTAIVASTLLARPRMSYYAVELFSSMPAVSPGGAVQEPAPAPVPAAKLVPPAPPKPVPKAEAPAPKDAIRTPGKAKPKPTPSKPAAAKPQPKSSAAFQAAMKALEAEGISGARPRGNAGVAGQSSGLVAEAGPAFPYPWYLKAIADKLDKQWNPPQEFESDTLCQVTFQIHRSGDISGAAVEKASGDPAFDQLALRAVLYANPLPPLPNGFPEETLRVHMKFVGKRS